MGNPLDGKGLLNILVSDLERELSQDTNILYDFIPHVSDKVVIIIIIDFFYYSIHIQVNFTYAYC